MKILYHHRTLADGAEGIHITEIVNALRELGHTIEMVCPEGPASSSASEGDGARRSVISRVRRRLPKLVFRLAEIVYNAVEFTRVSWAIRRFRPEFVYERYACFSFGGIVAAKRAGVPVILEVNTPYATAWEMYDRLYFKGIARWIERYVLRRADVVFTVSQALKEMLVAEGVEPGKIRVTHNAVNPAKIACAVNAATGSDKSDEVVVGFVGSLRSWHGIDLFMQAIPKVLQANPRVVFRIVGSGELEGEFRRFVDRAGRASRVLFVGRVSHEEALAHVVNMDIAVMPNSNAYGSPMKIFEYMALGKATIAPRLGPLEEIICDGVTGILIDPDNQNSLCGAIVELAQDAALRETIGRRAKEYVLGHHTWRKNAEQIVEAFAALDSGAMLEARPATG